MKLNRFTLTAIFFVSLLGIGFLNVAGVSADVMCNGKGDGTPCKLDADSISFTPGTCQSQVCTPNGTTMTTPNKVGSPGQITDSLIPGTSVDGSGIIKCGRPGQNMCTICNMIEGMNNVIQYLMKIAIGMALLAMAIGGVMYIVSAGDSGLIDSAKSTIKNAAIGFVIIFAGWLIINTTITYIGTYSDMGIGVTGWGQFNCNRSEPVLN